MGERVSRAPCRLMSGDDSRAASRGSRSAPQRCADGVVEEAHGAASTCAHTDAAATTRRCEHLQLVRGRTRESASLGRRGWAR
eukprot:5221040-Pleurochrysis_carterae.AAC.4